MGLNQATPLHTAILQIGDYPCFCHSLQGYFQDQAESYCQLWPESNSQYNGSSYSKLPNLVFGEELFSSSEILVSCCVILLDRQHVQTCDLVTAFPRLLMKLNNQLCNA